MQNSQAKSDGLFLSESLSEILTNDLEKQKSQILSLCNWAMSRFDEIQNIPEYMVLYKLLLELMEHIENKTSEQDIQKICSTHLVQLLYYLSMENLENCSIKVLLPHGSDCSEAYFLPTVLVKKQGATESKEKIQDKSENSITIFVSQGEKTLNPTPEWVDIALNTETIYSFVKSLCPLNSFSYDRMFLQSKLDSVKEKQDVKIWISGSSYAMAGINESQLPYSALNSAVNAQDVYYSLLSARKAVEACSSIETIVIPMAYYFLFLNIADVASDYMLSILSCIDYPVFKDLNGYTGELLPQDPPIKNINPIYDSILNKDIIKGEVFKPLCKELRELSYFNSKYNLRPAGGMLSYCFRNKTDEQNTRGAWARASAHNGNFKREKGVKNAVLIENFLKDMHESGRKVIFFTPPVTRFYQKAILQEMKEEYYALLNPMLEKFSCTFLDLTESPQFSNIHFQDYDHLNSDGAQVLSCIIAEHCK